MANQKATLTAVPLKASLNLNKIECDIKPYQGFHDDNALFIGGVKNNMYKKTFWDGDINGDKTFICHKDEKNFFAVNKGLNQIAVMEEEPQSDGTRDTKLIAMIDNGNTFVRSDEGTYEETNEKTITDADGVRYLINWVFQGGTLKLTVVTNPGDASARTVDQSFTTSCKNISFDFLTQEYILFSVYNKYAAKRISENMNILYNVSTHGFYTLNNNDTSKLGFLWKAHDHYLYVKYTSVSNVKNAGVHIFNGDSDLLSNISINGSFFNVSDNVAISNTTSLKAETATSYTEPVIRCNGAGCEVGFRKAVSTSGGVTEDCYNYFTKNGQSGEEGTISSDWYASSTDYTFLSICGDANYGLWSGGIQEHINDYFDVTFYGGVPFCISSNNTRVKIEQNIDEILWDECTSEEAVYTFEGKKYKLSVKNQDAGEVSYQVINDYIFFNVDSEDNTVRLSDGNVFNRCDDYIYLAIPYIEASHLSGDYYVSDKTYAEYATGYRVMYSRDNYSDIGMILAPLVVKKAFTSEAYSYFMPEGGYDDIQIFWGKTSAEDSSVGAPVYFTTLYNGYDSKYESVYYPVLTSNIIYNPSVLDKIEDTFFDEYIFNDGQYSYVSTRTQNQSIVLGYYIQTLAEFSKVFIIQGTHYAVQGNYIIQLNINAGVISGVAPLAYIGDLQYVGATVSEALFWSPIDRSFYTFKGDRTLTKFLESNRIKEVKSIFSQPSISCIAFSTIDDETDTDGNDKGSVLFFYGDQMIRLDIKTENRIYYTNNSFIIDNTEYCFLKRDGYTKEPINIETEFYSSQPFVEETNDCVYITLFDESPTKGTVKLSCLTLKEGQFKSQEKIFDISPSMFDKNQKYLRLRFQPQWQTGAFSFKIKSDFPIAGIAISHRQNNIANSAYND